MTVDTRAELRAYVNERAVTVPAGATAIDAVRALFPEQAHDIENGSARLTDSRGLPVSHTIAITGGAIFRVLPVRERNSDASSAEDAL